MAEELGRVPDLVEHNDLDQAVGLLLVYARRSCKRFVGEIVMLRGQLTNIQTEFRKGTISREEFHKDRSKLAMAVLELVDIFVEESGGADAGEKIESKDPADRKGIYISYAWADRAEVDLIDRVFERQGIMLMRDKKEVSYKGDIREFMQKLGDGGAVVVIVSDNYLKSKHCMHEALMLMAHRDFIERVYPIVLNTAARIYDSKQSIEYIDYWEKQVMRLNEKVRTLKNIANIDRIYADVNRVQRIRDAIDAFMNVIQSRNCLNYDDLVRAEFKPVIDAITKFAQGPTP